MIRAENVRVTYGRRAVLNGVSLTVAPGETIALMGSSGGGKTTFLKAIAGLIPCDGEVTLDGISLREEPERCRERMGMVFQNAALLDDLDVHGNIAFGLRRRGMRGRELEETIAHALEQAVLESDVATKRPDELSGGMRKRVGIARAIALSPKILLYDEPTTGLDPVTTHGIDTTIRELQRERGVTSVVVSHDLFSVRRIADEVAFLHMGDLVYVGDVEGLLASDHPAIRDTVAKAQAVSLNP